MIYKVMDRETNNGTFGEFATREEAEQFIATSEAEDKAEGTYSDDYYQIVEAEEENKMMTFEEACEKDRDELVDVFEIETADNICQGCIHLCDCPARVQFHNEQPSDSISACKFYEA